MFVGLNHSFSYWAINYPKWSSEISQNAIFKALCYTTNTQWIYLLFRSPVAALSSHSTSSTITSITN
jgi:hypothetical protein